MLENLVGKGDIHGKGLKRAKIKAMVDAYRKSPEYVKGRSFRYAHFNAHKILQLFIANGILDENKTIKEQEIKIKEHGLKIYLGLHISPDTLPGGDAKYMGITTTILCNTILAKGGEDMLYDLDKVALAGKEESNGDGESNDVEPGEGLDQAEVAPPYHISPDDEDHDIGYPG